MTIGRWNSVASDTRSSVSWNVERGPNNGRNCLGRTSRDAGHSRVPAPPHMISGMIRSLIVVLILVVVAIPRDETMNSLLNGGLGPETNVAHQIANIGKRFHYIARLHRQHVLY